MQITRNLAGHSLPLNLVFLVLNFSGLALTTMGFLDAFEANRLLLASLGISLLVFATAGLFFFKGRLLMAYVSSVIVGSVFIVSGLIKLNDPVGFAYKLEEYFQDGALAYRIKEWFGAPGFSLEFLIPHALGIGIFLCVLEVVLGVLLLIKGRMRLVSWLYLLLMLFFTFLTGHTASCDPKARFTDRDTYAASSVIADTKIEEARTNKDIKIISKSGGEVVVDELKTPQCVMDCGCFGDALKGSVGRSLTPTESFWKDLILLYLGIWIFVVRRHLDPNTVRQNWVLIPVALLIVAGLSWVIDWYFPILFTLVACLLALWIYKSRIRGLNNHFGSSLLAILLSAGFAWYNLHFDPLRDYRPWKVGTYLPAKTKDGRKGKFLNMVRYKNTQTGEVREYDALGNDFQESNIWEKPDWKYVNTVQKVIVPTILPSIDTIEFNPSRELEKLDAYERNLPFVKRVLQHQLVQGLVLKDVHTLEKITIPATNYNVEAYPADTYEIMDTTEVADEELTSVSARQFIFTAPKLILIVSRNPKEFDAAVIPELRVLCEQAEKAGVPVLLVSSADEEDLIAFKQKYNLQLAAFSNDETTLKAIMRSNPGILVLEHGWVKGKYTPGSLPAFNRIQTTLFNKKKHA